MVTGNRHRPIDDHTLNKHNAPDNKNTIRKYSCVHLLIGSASTVEGVRAGLPPETNGVEVVFVAAALAPPPASLAHAFTSSSSHS